MVVGNPDGFCDLPAGQLRLRLGAQQHEGAQAHVSKSVEFHASILSRAGKCGIAQEKSQAKAPVRLGV
ncbi:hypothetical protein GCM10009861_18340 [Neomicrococcus aestuarii]